MGLSSPDPLVNRFDMSDDPIGWARQRIALSRPAHEGREELGREEGRAELLPAAGLRHDPVREDAAT